MLLDCVIYCACYSVLFRGGVFFQTRCSYRSIIAHLSILKCHLGLLLCLLWLLQHFCYFTYYLYAGSTCEYYNGTEGYFKPESGTCYVTFPRDNHRAKQTWYNARNKCLLEGGDLADRHALSLPLPTDRRYLVGLQRDPFMWIESGKFYMQVC